MLCPVVGCRDCVSLLIKVVIYLYNDVSMLIKVKLVRAHLLSVSVQLTSSFFVIVLRKHMGSNIIHVSIYRHYRHTYIYTYVIIVYILDY